MNYKEKYYKLKAIVKIIEAITVCTAIGTMIGYSILF